MQNESSRLSALSLLNEEVSDKTDGNDHHQYDPPAGVPGGNQKRREQNSDNREERGKLRSSARRC
ncbi:hypothetical protein [Streptomyces sp. NPDC006324]|uniref:hypothetical protein n=1 Tax=Streptomyces sp. NPDC006324 TaxID=3156751 RepID=UPI0033AE0C69